MFFVNSSLIWGLAKLLRKAHLSRPASWARNLHLRTEPHLAHCSACRLKTWTVLFLNVGFKAKSNEPVEHEQRKRAATCASGCGAHARGLRSARAQVHEHSCVSQSGVQGLRGGGAGSWVHTGNGGRSRRREKGLGWKASSLICPQGLSLPYLHKY